MRKLLFISCYTPNEPYLSYRDKWLESYKEYESKVYEIVKQDSWYLTTQEKPKVMLIALLEHPEHDIVFTDIDSSLNRIPSLFFDENFRCTTDIALMGDKVQNKFFSGTVYISNNELGRWITKQWIRECQTAHNKHHRADDEIFAFLNSSGKLDQVNWTNLDPLYSSIADTVDNIPVTIKHLQASNHSRKEIRGLRNVRFVGDGTYKLIREDDIARKHLDSLYERVDSNTWRPRLRELSNIGTFPSIWNIVGKGPSLDDINYLEGPTIGINDSVRILEAKKLGDPLFCVCQDLSGLRDYIPLCTMLLSPNAFSRFHSFENAYSFTYKGKEGPNTISAVIAMRLATELGATGFRLYGFDSRNGEYSYAKSIGYDSGPRNFRFKDHCRYIEEATNLPIEWC